MDKKTENLKKEIAKINKFLRKLDSITSKKKGDK